MVPKALPAPLIFDLLRGGKEQVLQALPHRTIFWHLSSIGSTWKTWNVVKEGKHKLLPGGTRQPFQHEEEHSSSLLEQEPRKHLLQSQASRACPMQSSILSSFTPWLGERESLRIKWSSVKSCLFGSKSCNKQLTCNPCSLFCKPDLPKGLFGKPWPD